MIAAAAAIGLMVNLVLSCLSAWFLAALVARHGLRAGYRRWWRTLTERQP